MTEIGYFRTDTDRIKDKIGRLRTELGQQKVSAMKQKGSMLI